MIEWETGENTKGRLQLIESDDPVTCVVYTKENKLPNKPGWKHFKKFAKRETMLT
jgi:hypothetical protein